MKFTITFMRDNSLRKKITSSKVRTFIEILRVFYSCDGAATPSPLNNFYNFRQFRQIIGKILMAFKSNQFECLSYLKLTLFDWRFIQWTHNFMHSFLKLLHYYEKDKDDIQMYFDLCKFAAFK